MIAEKSHQANAVRIRELRLILLALVSVSVIALPRAAWAAAPENSRERTGDRVRVEVSGAVEAPFERVRAVLLDLEGFAAWFPRLDEWRVLSREPSSALVYGRQAVPWPVSDRDYVVRYRWWDAADGVFVLEAVGQVQAQPDAPDGVVRLHDLRSEWRLEASGDGTRARYEYEGPVGPLPEWVERIRWRQGTGALIEALAGEVARRAGGPPGP